MIKNIQTKKSAFSLIEVIMILFIASVGIMAALSLAIRSAYFQQAKKELGTAMFLANEGIEIMKNIRDTNVILVNEYDNWTGTGSPGNGVHLYKVDYATLLATTTTSIDTAVLQQSTSTDFYLHNSSFPNSIFSRLITASTTGEVTEVESWVQWKSRGNVFNYKINTALYDKSF
jgi:Tfp pilus assembly protein PilV